MRRITRALPALFIVAVLAATAMAAQESRVAPLRADTPHGHVHRVAEVRYVAKRAWRQPFGPTKAQVARYRHALKYPVRGTRGAMRVVWSRKADALESHRRLARTWKLCGDGSFTAKKFCLKHASLKYGGGLYSWLYAITDCETGGTWDPGAYNSSSGATGPFQFKLGTWGTTPYSRQDVNTYRWASLGAAWMYRQGRAGEWSCN